MAKAIIESVELPWGGVKLNRQQRISILFNILFWSFYCTTASTQFSIVPARLETPTSRAGWEDCCQYLKS